MFDKANGSRSAVPPGTHEPMAGAADSPPAAALTNEELVGRFSELAGHLNSGTARYLLLLGEIDARRVWADHGARTCSEWLSWRVGISGVAAREQLRVARALKELPVTARAFVAGRVSYSKVRAMTRVATPETEADLVEWATHTTAADIERFCRTYRRVVGRAELDEANERHRRRHVSWYYDDDGSLVIVGRLSPEDGAAVVKALEAGRALVASESREESGAEADGDDSAETSEPADARNPDVGNAAEDSDATGNVSAETFPDGAPDASRESSGGPVSNADALVAIAHHMLTQPPPGLSEGAIPELVVHIDLDVLKGVDDDAVRCALEGGPAIPPETARRLGCDSSVVPLLEKDGEPVTTGTRSRAIPRAIRRALEHRDGGCRWPGCERKAWVQAHHVHFWGNGGSHELTNLVLLCPHHHRLVHEGGYAVESIGPNRFRFARTDGSEIEHVPKPLHSGPGRLEASTAAAAIGIDEETCVPEWDGQFMDVSVAVEGMLAANGVL